jgi:hypothetical protein
VKRELQDDFNPFQPSYSKAQAAATELLEDVANNRQIINTGYYLPAICKK